MSLQYSVLASGSTGNAIFIRTERVRLLVDVGLTGKKITQLLQSIGEDAANLDAILVTHEHSDHIKGLGVLARKHRIPVYANIATWQEIDRLCGNIDEEQKFSFERQHRQTFADIEVESFGISHDAVEPMSFCFYHDGQKLSICTDLGYVSERIKHTVRDSDVLIFEANHDVNMLRMGRYPWNVKRRILSDVGHLSNESCAEALIDIIGDGHADVYLAHLSQDTNMQDLARMTVQQILENAGVAVGKSVLLYDTYPDKPTQLASVKGLKRI